MPDRADPEPVRPTARRATRRGRLAVGLVALVASGAMVAACESTPSDVAADPAVTTAPTESGSAASTTPDDPAGRTDAAGPDGAAADITTTAATRPTWPTATVVTGGTAVAHPDDGARAGSVHTVDLDDLTYPSSICAGVIDRPPRGYDLEDGQARSTPEDTDPYAVVLRSQRSFGDVNDDGHDDVALVIECGHESQPVPLGWIYTVDGSGPRPLAQVQLDPDELPFTGVLDTSLRTVRIAGSTVITEWSVYLDGDAICCPTKVATVSWTWTNGLLAPGPASFEKAPADG